LYRYNKLFYFPYFCQTKDLIKKIK